MRKVLTAARHFAKVKERVQASLRTLMKKETMFLIALIIVAIILAISTVFSLVSQI